LTKRDFKWEYVVILALLTIAVLGLGNYSYEALGVKKPLLSTISKDPDVISAQVQSRDGKTLVVVDLKEVKDLSKTYRRLYEAAAKYVNPANLELEVKDRRDQELEDTYMNIHYYLEEAAVRGDFGSMIEAAKKVLDRSGVEDYRLVVDRGSIFVQITKGQNYLYEVIHTSKPQGEGGA